MAESIPSKDMKTKEGKSGRAGHIKMFVIDDLKASTIDSKVSEYLDKESVIDSDNSSSYTNFQSLVKEHRPKVMPKNEVGKLLPWVPYSCQQCKTNVIGCISRYKT